jgi:hypothetical protein
VRLIVEIDGSLAEIAETEIRAAEAAVTAGVREVGASVKTAWRGAVTSAGLGRRLANAVRLRGYPAGGKSLGAAALVYAQPNRKPTASAADVIDAFDRGALIRSQLGFWLAIPLPAAGPVAGNGRRGRLTPGIWEQRTGIRLRFVFRRGRPSLLVADDARLNKDGSALQKRGRRRKDGMLTGAATVPVFLMLPRARLRKRLDLDRSARGASENLARAILAHWNQEGA